ncbi:MAG: LysR family transcriptional regulator [Parvularculaceae bacterium]
MTLTMPRPPTKLKCRLHPKSIANGYCLTTLRVRANYRRRRRNYGDCMEMHQVRYFLAVARLLNFTRAAEECHVAQPSLTRAIKQLEEELGGELFRRERNLTHLSELGHRMLPLMQQCYDSAQAAKQVATSIKKGAIAPLSIALPMTVNIELLLPMLKELVRAFPGLTLKFLRGTGAEIMEHMKKGAAEVAVAAKLPEEWDRLESWSIFTEPYVLVVAPSHPFAAGSAPVSTDDLKRQRLFCRPYCEDFAKGVTFLEAAGVDVEKIHNAGSDSDFISMLAADLGVGFAPLSLTRSDRIRIVNVDGFDLNRTVSVHAVAGRQRSPAASTLIKMLRANDWGATERSTKAA